MRLLVIIPAHNEEKSIARVIADIPMTLAGIMDIRSIVVDDGSTDDTVRSSKASGARVVSHPTRLGLAAAFRTGLKEALTQGADVIVTLDADGQYRAGEIADLWKEMQKTGADLVVGNRCVVSCKHMPIGNRIGNVIGSAMLWVLRLTPIHDASSGFRIFSSRLGKSLRIMSRHTYTHEMLIQANAHGFHTSEIPVTFLQREHGKSKLVRTLRHHILRSCGTIVRCTFLYRALRRRVPAAVMPKKVLFISRTLGSGFGGMQTYAHSLIEALRKHEDVSLTVVGYGGGTVFLPFFFLRALFVAVFTRSSVVHCGDAFLSLIFPVLAVLRPRLLRTVTVHGLDVTWNAWGYQTLIRHSLRFAQKIAAVSRATADACRDLGISQQRIIVIPCGINVPTVASRKIPPEPVLLFLGRLVPRKGVAWFVAEVFPLLLARYPTMKFVIAGDGPEFSRICSLVASQKLSSSVDVLGAVPERAKEALLQSATMLVMPNIPVFGDMEGFGITALEAASRGVPVVAADLEGLRDSVIEDVTGFRFLPLDLQSACVAVEKALKKKWSTDEMRKLVTKTFAIDLVASRYVYEIF